MTGSVMMLMASGGGHLTGSNGSVLNTSISSGIRSGSFALINDGTFTGTGTGGGSWFTPTTTGIGSNWSAKAVINTTAGTTSSGTFGSFVSLSGTTTWGFTNAGATTEGTGNMTVSFSPDGGTTTAGTMNVGWDVGFTP